MDGWFKLHREIRSHWIYPNRRKFTEYEAWLDLLIRCNWKAGKAKIDKQLITVARGQFITSQLKLSFDWLWSRTEVRNFLEMLQKDKMIIKKTTSKYTMLTICNFDSYQESEPTTRQPKNNGRTTGEQREDTIEERKEPKERKDKKARELDFYNKSQEINLKLKILTDDKFEAFFSYWTESNEGDTKIRFEMEKVFDYSKRMGTWKRNNYNSKNDPNKFPDVWDAKFVSMKCQDPLFYKAYCKHLEGKGLVKKVIPGQGERYVKRSESSVDMGDKRLGEDRVNIKDIINDIQKGDEDA